MALNTKKIKSTGGKGNFVEQPLLPVDNYPARVVQIIDLGLQDGGEWAGEKKPPVNKLRMTYELTDAFMVDADGKEREDAPIWLSEDIKLYSPEVDRATCNKRYKAIDPEEVFDYDWAQLIGSPCTILTKHKESKGKTYCNVANVSPYVVSRRNPELPELVNQAKVFTLDEPDMEVFDSLPEWIREQVMANLEFKGSPLDIALNGGAKPKAKPKAEPEPDSGEDFEDDVPWQERL